MKISTSLSKIWLFVWFGASLICEIFLDSPYFQLGRSLEAPDFRMLYFGSDTYGRNILHLVSEASFLSMSFAVVCVTLSAIVALAVAALSPQLPRGLYWLIESTLGFLLSFPSLLIALTVAGFFGPGRLTIALAIVLGATPHLTRTLWVRCREITQLNFVWAARSLGASPFHLALKHYLPQLYSLTRVKIPSLITQALIAEASLSFLGLGFPSGQESWGSLLAQARDYLIEAPHISLVVGTPLILSLLALDIISKSGHPRLT